VKIDEERPDQVCRPERYVAGCPASSTGSPTANGYQWLATDHEDGSIDRTLGEHAGRPECLPLTDLTVTVTPDGTAPVRTTTLPDSQPGYQNTLAQPAVPTRWH
jgi:hypothetical protein